MLEEAFSIFSTSYSYADVFCTSFIIGILIFSAGIVLSLDHFHDYLKQYFEKQRVNTILIKFAKDTNLKFS